MLSDLSSGATLAGAQPWLRVAQLVGQGGVRLLLQWKFLRTSALAGPEHCGLARRHLCRQSPPPGTHQLQQTAQAGRQSQASVLLAGGSAKRSR